MINLSKLSHHRCVDLKLNCVGGNEILLRRIGESGMTEVLALPHTMHENSSARTKTSIS